MSDIQSDYLCQDCGFVANHLMCLKKYGRRSNKPMFEVSTVAIRICDICGKEKPCAPYRDYYFPTERATKAVRNYITKGDV